MLFCSAPELSLCKGRTLKNQAKTWQEFHQHSKVVSMMKQPDNMDGESANEADPVYAATWGFGTRKVFRSIPLPKVPFLILQEEESST